MITVEQIDVTPELAGQWLLLNIKNRIIRDNVVAKYARDMVAGHWREDGAPVRFNWDNRMFDGQHRCLAIVQSGVTLRLVVVRNADPKAQATVDSGIPRSYADHLKLLGERDPSSLAAITRRVVMWQAGSADRRSSLRPSTDELDSVLARHPGLRLSTDAARRVARHANITPSVAGLAHHLFTALDPYATEEFFQKLTTMEGIVTGDPAGALLRTLGGGPHRLPESHQLAYTIKAWNLTRQGRTVGHLQAPAGGWSEANFPSPT